VRDNLEFPLRNEGLPRKEIDRRINEVAGILRIEHLLGSRIGGLAGGDRQRVALGRAIVRQPKAFLMDEPLGTLDAEFRELMCVELRKLHDRLRTTTVFVTHDQNEAMALADRIVVMNQGEILQADSPEGIYNFPSCVFVASFIGRPPMNFLQVDGAVAAGSDQVSLGGLRVSVPEVREASERALLGVRPEHVRLVDEPDALPAKIRHVEYFGSHWIAELQTPSGVIKALVDKDLQPREGDRVQARFDTERVVLFDAASERLLSSATTCNHRPSVPHG
jgi:multiple sugar transport system ATP-binding protein